jgi:hypothetical protein
MLTRNARFRITRMATGLVVETGDSGFVENSWIGRTLALGLKLDDRRRSHQ